MSKPKKKPIKTFAVGVCVTVTSHVEVKARTKEEAGKKARNLYYKNWKDDSHHGLDCPCIDVDFDRDEDIEEYEDDKTI